MKESVTYQAILEEWREEVRQKAFEEAYKQGYQEGRIEEAQRILLLLGTALSGKPSVKVRRALAGITDVELLESLLLRVVKVSNWTDLLANLP